MKTTLVILALSMPAALKLFQSFPAVGIKRSPDPMSTRIKPLFVPIKCYVCRRTVLLARLAGCPEYCLALTRLSVGRQKACRQDEMAVAYDRDIESAVPERIGRGSKSGQGMRCKARSGCGEKLATIECRH